MPFGLSVFGTLIFALLQTIAVLIYAHERAMDQLEIQKNTMKAKSN
jgi:hypothetical protein